MDSEAAGESGNGLASQQAARIAKLEAFRAAGINPYPPGPFPRIPTAEARSAAVDTDVEVAGRIVLFRHMGNVIFLNLRDESGEVQIMLSKRELTDPPGVEAFYKFLVKNLDLGDILHVTGTTMVTKAGEPSVLASTVQMLAKSLRPMPDKHSGLSNEDLLLRKRYLGMLQDRSIQDLAVRRAAFWRATRTFLEERDFLEVHTPVLELAAGGADAQPFITHHNAYDCDVKLRISMGELWQKRLLVGGLEKTYEIGRQFRNENPSRDHANDYVQLEFYWAYANFAWGMEFVRDLYRQVMQATYGTLSFSLERGGQTYDVDLSNEWATLDFAETLLDLTGIDIQSASTETLIAEADKRVPDSATPTNRSRALDLIWKSCRREVTGPAFLINQPIELSPLAKADPQNPEVAQRFHVVIAGSELGNGYSELNDPQEQHARFAEQAALRAAGDGEAQETDLDFVEALEHGMPPAFGFGMSERVFAFFDNRTLRDAQLFPLLKPLASPNEASPSDGPVADS